MSDAAPSTERGRAFGDAPGLRELRGALEPYRGVDGVKEALDRLDRDLLPRTAAGHEHLVVGIVGPNNAGKSALFNALVHRAEVPGAEAGRAVSPSLPIGGATRRLVGAMHPKLESALLAEPTLQQFLMRSVTPDLEGALDSATTTAEPGREHELLVVIDEDLPESLLLVDTPDFDSVLTENRLVTDALLTVADVAVVVVTRHTYQNHDVIEFLKHWLSHGRPWLLVYNESIDAETTRKHAAKIEEDIGGAPEGVFHAMFDRDVASGAHALVPMALDAAEGGAASLCTWLHDVGARRDLKARALAASLALLRDDLREIGAKARSVAANCVEVHSIARTHAAVLGRFVAREAMPMGPFLEAFREVLDERPTLVQRELRKGLKWTSGKILGGARWAAAKVKGVPEVDSSVEGQHSTLLDAERLELTARWTGFFEPAITGLRAAQRSGRFSESVSALIDLRARKTANPAEALGRASDLLGLDPALMEEYRAACRTLITEELDRGSSEWALQLAVDAMHLLPVGVAGALIVHTGGLGADVAVAGGGALSAALAERLSRTLGTGVASTARDRWVTLRSERIADAALAGLLGDEGGAIDELETRMNTLAEITVKTRLEQA